MKKITENLKIKIIGLGYVGLPLAIEFAKKYTTVGYDISQRRVEELMGGRDATNEVTSSELKASSLTFSNSLDALCEGDVYIVTVPTPIDEANKPDLGPLKSACVQIGQCIGKGAVIIFESTVYPGATEEFCVPILEKYSNLKFNSDFFVGYSPERINPGDNGHRLPDIIKVTSGSTKECADYVDELYRSIIKAGTHKTTSIRVAEAAKVIENTQRDVNIALMNELSLIFEKLSINTNEVISAASTKWNFLKFYPGLVGGHCIGVDPYYLTHKAQQVGYIPEVILSGRRLNDSMGKHVGSTVVKLMANKNIGVANSDILILGFTFKEDCPDIRNTKVIDIFNELKSYNANVDVCDPICPVEDAIEHFGIQVNASISDKKYDAVIFAVAHTAYKKMTLDYFAPYLKENHIIADLKGIFESSKVDYQL